ncbi:MAG TPA: SIR2 family protein [Pyrinomonadaceae bacterium]|nr:SIR2 family protein [Pyrinomonadaceae bacterium]
MAILLAYLIELEEAETQIESTDQFKQRLKDEPYPPLASELAELFGRDSEYSTYPQLIKTLREMFPEQLLTADEDEQVATLQLLSRVTRIANPPEPLTSITSYYEKLLGRDKLWRTLTEIFRTKNTPTLTHRLLAQSAQYHLAQQGALDYLIITTNYDCLMESALDELKVPYVVLTTNRGNKPKVLIRCSSTVPDGEDLKRKYFNTVFPYNFQMMKATSLVIIYKIHGCINSELEYADEGVVISDNDYVDYVSQMARTDGVIPAHVTELMREKPFWFLGYSLSDWNVRSIYETLKARSNPDQRPTKDYAVTRKVGPFEKLFFDKNDITIFEVELNEFVRGILDAR